MPLIPKREIARSILASAIDDKLRQLNPHEPLWLEGAAQAIVGAIDQLYLRPALGALAEDGD